METKPLRAQDNSWVRANGAVVPQYTSCDPGKSMSASDPQSEVPEYRWKSLDLGDEPSPLFWAMGE
jgi:hypothetical protein